MLTIPCHYNAVTDTSYIQYMYTYYARNNIYIGLRHARLQFCIFKSDLPMLKTLYIQQTLNSITHIVVMLTIITLVSMVLAEVFVNAIKCDTNTSTK